MLNTNGYSLSDIAAVSGGESFGGASWWIIILFLFAFMGGGAWGGPGYGYATQTDIENQFNFASLERQNGTIVDAVHQSAYDVTGALKDGNTFTQSMMKDIAYDINGELKDNAYHIGEAIRDVDMLVQQNGYELAKGFSDVNSHIDAIKYDNAMNTRELLASNCAQTQKILDVLTGNRMADMQNQINQLQLQSALAGVVRYPVSTTYTAGFSPCFMANQGYYGG